MGSSDLFWASSSGRLTRKELDEKAGKWDIADGEIHVREIAGSGTCKNVGLKWE